MSRKSGIGVSLWGGGEYQVPLSPALRLRAGADASAREYRGGAFDRHSVSAHIGPRRLIDARTEASLLAVVDRQWTAGRPETDRFGVRLEGAHRLTPRLALFAHTSAARRNCRGCNWLDGPVGDVMLGASWAALPTAPIKRAGPWQTDNPTRRNTRRTSLEHHLLRPKRHHSANFSTCLTGGSRVYVRDGIRRVLRWLSSGPAVLATTP